MKVSDSASQVFAVFAIIVIVATLIAFGIGLLEQSLPAMPNVDMVPINNSGWLDGIGTGACARVQMEVRGQMVVWRLQDGRVAVVAVLVSEGVTMVMDDFDLDGRVDRIETIPAGTGTISEDFEQVEACR